MADNDPSRARKETVTVVTPFLWHGIFRYADRIDYLLMFLGTLGAAGNGILITLFSLFFGDLV